MCNLNQKGKKKDKGDNQENFRFVTQRIKESGKKGWAVLCRTNLHLDSIESAFSEIGVDTVRIGGKSIFDNEHAIGIISLFAGVVNRTSLNELITGLGWTGEPAFLKLIQQGDVFKHARLCWYSLKQCNSYTIYTNPPKSIKLGVVRSLTFLSR